MEKRIITTRITQKHDNQESWESVPSFIPKDGEIIVYDSDSSHNLPRIKIGNGDQTVSNLPFTVDYNESIIALEVDGQTVTYTKGDGSVHSFQTQDTNTTYSLGTATVTGLTKLYATIGNAEDGTMTQKAIKTELDKKVGVEINSSENQLVFVI